MKYDREVLRHYFDRFHLADHALDSTQELMGNVNSLLGEDKLEDFVLQEIDGHLDVFFFSNSLLAIIRDVKAVLSSGQRIHLECHTLAVISWKLEVTGLNYYDLGPEKGRNGSKHVLEFSLDSGKKFEWTAHGLEWRIVGPVFKQYIVANMVAKQL